MHDCNLKIRNIIVLAIALTPLLPLHAHATNGTILGTTAYVFEH
jgi:hypothetical protein